MQQSQEQQDPVIPKQLVELASEAKPTDYALGLIEYYEGDVKNALNYDMISAPRGGPLSYESFLAAVRLDVASNSRLAEAMTSSPASFMKSILLAAQTKLLPGGAYDLLYLIPRWNGKERRMEVTPLISYKGLSDLAQRHPRVHKVDAVLVFEGEHFDYDAGAGKLSHKVNLMGERTEDKIIGGYARVVITEPSSTHPVLDDPVIHVMNRDQLMAIKERSDAYQQAEKPSKYGDGTPRRNSAWHTDPLPMHRKTLLRAVLNGGSVPKDMGVGGAIAADDHAQIPQEEPKAVNATSRTQSLRVGLGLDEAPAEESFEWVEDAEEAMAQAETLEEMEALKPRWQHFEGEEAKRIGEAYERNEDRLKA